MNNPMLQLDMWIQVERDHLKRKLLVEIQDMIVHLTTELNKGRHDSEDAVEHTSSPAIPWMGGAKQEDHL